MFEIVEGGHGWFMEYLSVVMGIIRCWVFIINVWDKWGTTLDVVMGGYEWCLGDCGANGWCLRWLGVT